MRKGVKLFTDEMNLEQRITDILSGESCRNIRMNLSCNYILANTVECKECQCKQILTLLPEKPELEDADPTGEIWTENCPATYYGCWIAGKQAQLEADQAAVDKAWEMK